MRRPQEGKQSQREAAAASSSSRLSLLLRPVICQSPFIFYFTLRAAHNIHTTTHRAVRPCTRLAKKSNRIIYIIPCHPHSQRCPPLPPLAVAPAMPSKYCWAPWKKTERENFPSLSSRRPSSSKLSCTRLMAPSSACLDGCIRNTPTLSSLLNETEDASSLLLGT